MHGKRPIRRCGHKGKDLYTKFVNTQSVPPRLMARDGKVVGTSWRERHQCNTFASGQPNCTTLAYASLPNFCACSRIFFAFTPTRSDLALEVLNLEVPCFRPPLNFLASFVDIVVRF